METDPRGYCAAVACPPIVHPTPRSVASSGATTPLRNGLLVLFHCGQCEGTLVSSPGSGDPGHQFRPQVSARGSAPGKRMGRGRTPEGLRPPPGPKGSAGSGHVAWKTVPCVAAGRL